ncbi:MAG: M15 family metallopeptidase [Bacillota bacterium]
MKNNTVNQTNHKIAALKEVSWQKIGEIPIREFGEELIPASYIPGKIIVRPAYFIEGIPGSFPECYVRRSVLDKLIQAAEYLEPSYKFILFDSWRPYKIQKKLFELYLHKLKKEHPHLDEDTLKKKAGKYVAPPSQDPAAPSPHSTGGAVDISIVDGRGRLLNMGTKFDATNERSSTRYYENLHRKKGKLNQVEKLYLNNRRLLYNVMTEVGFTNYPEEWWHYDFGNQSWAYFSDKETAFYGETEPEFAWKSQVYN